MELRRREPPALPSVFVLAEFAGVRDLLRFVDGLFRGKTYHTPYFGWPRPGGVTKNVVSVGSWVPAAADK